MKKNLLVILFLVAGFVNSCVSIHDSRIGPNDSQLKVLGQVKKEFTSFQPFHIPITSALKESAYKRLLEAAITRYGAEYGINIIDIVNIKIEGEVDASNPGQVLYDVFFFFTGNFQRLYISGTAVVNPNKQQTINNQESNINTNALEKAVKKIGDTLVSRLSRGSTIAVLSISGTTNAGQIIDELEFKLVDKGTDLRIVERRLLAQIRLEQGFQMTGEVNDESAVSIGNMLGANIVITGSMTNSGNKQRLTVKALDVKTAQIIAMARNDF